MKLITFTEKMGTNGSEVAREVAKKLGYKIYDTEAINKMAREMGFLESVTKVDEKVPSIFERLFSHRPDIYFDRLYSVIYELAKQGDVVFLGRGSHVLLKAFNCALHVRVTASLEKRIQNLIERGFHREAAIKAIERSDHERSMFVKSAFGVDWETPELYDLVLNMDKLSIDLAVNIVLNMAHSDEIKECSVDAIQSLETMGLAKRAEAALIEAGLTHGPTAAVTVTVSEPGKIQLSGVAGQIAEKIMAEKIVAALPGAVSIDNQIHVKVVGHYT
jgi:cytidylate kinase